MAEALATYESGGELYLNGKLLAEVTKYTVNHMGNLNKVVTTKKGLAGTAAGPLEVEISVTSAMPKAGMELDYYSALVNRTAMTFRRRAHGQTRSYTVKADGLDESYDASNAADATVKLIGKPIGVTT